MKFVACNFFTNDNSIVENYFDQKVFKELAYASKMKTKLPNGKIDLNYDYVLIPVEDLPKVLSEEFLLMQDIMLPRIYSETQLSQEIIFSIINKFVGGNRSMLEKIFLEIRFIKEIDDSEIEITYSDGSFKKATNEASYGVTKLLAESDSGLYDDFTGKKFLHQDFSEKIADGTNNIGELTGLKIAVQNFGDKEYQLIVSDSEYSIKCFREWYYAWRDNNFRNYAKKEIANKKLVLEIFKSITDSKKKVVFKWIKGHNKSPFNELCDELAKNAFDK